jgi:hypothetical protein
MAATSYFLAADPSWNLLQLQNVNLKYDTSLTDADVFLPELSTVSAFEVQIQIANVGGGTVNLFAYSEVGPPPVQNTIGGAISFSFTGDGLIYTLKIRQIDGVGIEWEIEEPVSSVAAAIAQGDLATPQYVNLPVGFVVYVTDYDGSGKGCSIQKTTATNGDFQDWVVTATEDTTSTGGFGVNPI